MFDIRTDNQLTVSIRVVPDATGPAAHLVYVPAVLHAHAGDSITWVCESGPSVIQFLRGGPLGRVHYHSDGHRIGPVPVPTAAPHGAHRYAVAVFSDGAVCIDAECPEIIID